MNIVLFGGSYCTKEYYNKVYNFVKLKLNDTKNTIITDGTIGTMEAVNKAAKENNIKSVGITLFKWKNYINEYVDDLKIFENKLDRLNYIIKKGDLFICLDGDIGTLAELFPTWMCIIDKKKKLYIMSNKIIDTLEYMYNKDYIKQDSKKYITYTSFNEFNI